MLLEVPTIGRKLLMQVFNILCEQPEIAAAYLVPRARSVAARSDDQTYIRFLTSAPLPFLSLRFLRVNAGKSLDVVAQLWLFRIWARVGSALSKYKSQLLISSRLLRV